MEPLIMLASTIKGIRVSSTRIIEAVAIAAITALGVKLMSIDNLNAKLEYLSDQVIEVKASVEKIRNDIYVTRDRR